ncbi:MAG: hypothetical protein HOC79_05355 [Euryarchaeota archaeon]|nr:hypothetical protein [Euryarchaeota archaeon]
MSLMIHLEEKVFRLENLCEHCKKEQLAIHSLMPHELAVRIEGEDTHYDENFWIFELIDARRNADEALDNAIKALTVVYNEIILLKHAEGV